jgi:CDP-glycerol glycerophosphotransferase (TagB/SpsB family)
VLVDTISKLVKEKKWNWRLTFHPKLNDQALLNRYRQLAAEHSNVTFVDNASLEDFRKSDVMLCDSSSIILEFMLMDKPVVTYRNTNPGEHLLNVTEVGDVGNAIEVALTRPETLMKEVNKFAQYHEAYRDGRNCERILNALDDFNDNYKGKIKPKPLNLWRKFRLRNKLKYWK